VTDKAGLDKGRMFPRVKSGTPVMPSKVPHQITVLLVEDEESLRHLLTKVLVQSGLNVLVAESGDQALALWDQQNGRVDVLATDLIMDGMNGFELAEKLREKKPDLRVICMTGYSMDMLAGQISRHPDFMILQKPFRPRDLADQVREQLFPTPGSIVPA
jgi:two-component system, cell cycle sensor histidine kinase and response regulator CckA